MQKPSFFGAQTNTHHTSEKQSPQDIKLLARPDMALAVFLTDKLLAQNKSVISSLHTIGMKSVSPNLSTSQAMLGWLYTLSNQIKQFALTQSPSIAYPQKTWLISTLSAALRLDINVAILGGPKDFAYATFPEKPYQIIVTGNGEETNYTIPVRFGSLFECLKQHTAFRTDSEIDASLQSHIASTVKDILAEQKQFSQRVNHRMINSNHRMSDEEMVSFYVENYAVLSKLCVSGAYSNDERHGADAHLTQLLQQVLTAQALTEDIQLAKEEYSSYRPMGFAY